MVKEIIIVDDIAKQKGVQVLIKIKQNEKVICRSRAYIFIGGL